MFLIPLVLMLLGALDKQPGKALIVLAVIVPLLISGSAFVRNASWEWLSTALAALLVVSVCFICLLLYPGWYPYGWHNLMQMDVIYSTLSGIDLHYFSETLSYPFLGLLPLSLLSQLLSISPLHLFLPLNAICFMAWFAVYAIHVRAKYSTVDSLASVAIAFLFSGFGLLLYWGLSGLVDMALSGAGHGFSMPVAEVRVSPIISKYPHVDAMTIGLPSLAFQYFFSRGTTPASRLLSLLFGVQTILSYPLLGPTALLIPFASAIYNREQRLTAALTLVLLAGVLFAAVYGDSPRGGASIASFNGPGHFIVHGLGLGLIICSPFLIAVLYRSYRLGSLAETREALTIFTCSLIAYALFKMPVTVQYKFLYGAMVVLAFETCREIAFHLTKLGARKALVYPALVACGLVVSVYQLGVQAPSLRGVIPGIDSAGFFISTKESREIEAFLKDAGVAGTRGLIVANADFPSTALLRIPQYMNLHDEPMVGYEMPYSVINEDVKRHDAAEFRDRERLAKALLVDHRYDIASGLKTTFKADFLMLISDNPLERCPGRQHGTGGETASGTGPARHLFVCLL